MNKNTWIAVIVIILIILGGWYYQTNKPAPATGEPIKVGVIIPLSGSNALHGQYSERGIEMALAELGNRGAENLDIIYEDSQFDPKLAVNAYNKLVKTDGVKAVIFLGSPVGMALAPLANQDHVPLLGIVSAPAYSTPNDYTFRTVGSAIVESKAMADTVINKLQSKTVAILAMNNDYGKGVVAGFKGAVGNQVKIVAEESFLPTNYDYRSQLTKIKFLNPDLVLVPALGKETGMVLKQARSLGMRNIFMCASACENQDLITAAGDAAEGLIVTAPTNEANANFSNIYRKKYGEAPNFVSMRMYDATNILLYAFGQCSTSNDLDCLRKTISAINGLPGSSYSIIFDSNGDINDQFIIKTVKDGQFVKLEE